MSSDGRTSRNLFMDFKKAGYANPYVFSVEKEISSEKENKPEKRPSYEEKILLEQRRTIFEADSFLKESFLGDFESFLRVIDNPDDLLFKLEENIDDAILELGLDLEYPEHNLGNDESLRFDIDSEKGSGPVFDFDEEDFEVDELYEKAEKWARRLFMVGNKIYEEKSIKDPDLFRVLANIFLVPSKIIYASCSEELGPGLESEDESDIKISLSSYSLALVFLRRVRESLNSLVERKFRPLSEWRKAILVADEISLGLQGRILDIAKRLRKF